MVFLLFLVHKPGTPMDKVENGFTSKICKSEFIWDAAQRAGLKTALISYPHSLPKTAKAIL